MRKFIEGVIEMILEDVSCEHTTDSDGSGKRIHDVSYSLQNEKEIIEKCLEAIPEVKPKIVEEMNIRSEFDLDFLERKISRHENLVRKYSGDFNYSSERAFKAQLLEADNYEILELESDKVLEKLRRSRKRLNTFRLVMVFLQNQWDKIAFSKLPIEYLEGFKEKFFALASDLDIEISKKKRQK